MKMRRMEILTALTIILAIATIGSQASVISTKAEQNVDVIVLTPEQMETFLRDNPDAVELQRKELPDTNKETRDDTIYPFYYYDGERICGDRRVANYYRADSYSARDVVMTASYPSSGTGSVITFFSIDVNQRSKISRAYKKSGGIGYRYLTVVVEADNTTYFQFEINIYGIL